MKKITTRERIERALLFILAGTCLAVIASTVDGCTPAQLAGVKSAENKRETICAFVSAWAPANPELAGAAKLCQSSAELQEIAAAYAGCTRPLATRE